MSTASPASIAEKFVDAVWNSPSGIDAVEGFLASDYVDHAYPGHARGLRSAVAELRNGFPDAQFVIESIAENDDEVALRMRLQATHLGVFRGQSATGKPVDVRLFRWFRVEDDRIAEHWALFDTRALLSQIAQTA